LVEIVFIPFLLLDFNISVVKIHILGISCTLDVEKQWFDFVRLILLFSFWFIYLELEIKISLFIPVK
jgi:hypothetical protein